MSYIYGPGSVLLEGWGGRAPEFFHLLRDGQAVLLPGDGRALLHPGYVTDLASAFGNALESPETIGQIYNIGGPRAVMMGDYIARIAAELGVEPKIEYVDPEKILTQFSALVDRCGLFFACEHMCCDISKAHREMGVATDNTSRERPGEEYSLDAGRGPRVSWFSGPPARVTRRGNYRNRVPVDFAEDITSTKSQ